MKAVIKCIYFMIIALFLTNCVPAISTIVNCTYDTKKNQTYHLVFPYGQVSIPDKWTKIQYNNISKQQFFTNSDSIRIAIAFSLCNRYEFNQDNSIKGFEFVEAFYEWESKYFEDTFGLQIEEIARNNIDNYIIWRLYGSYKDAFIDTYFLFGEKECHVKNFSVMATNKWSEEQKIVFLKNLYQNSNTTRQ